jgi:serine phosphatase RsbU (regulator of sigma subunit)
MIPNHQEHSPEQVQESPPRRGLFGSLRTRLRWSYALVSVIPLVLLGILLINTSYQTQRQNIEANQQTAADWVAREITNHLSTINDQLLKFGARVRPDQPSPQMLDTIFTLRETMPEIIDVSVMDAGGRERVHVSDLQLFHDEDLLDRSSDQLVQWVLTSGRVAQGPVARSAGSAVYSSYAPIFNDAGRVIGVIRAEVSTSRLERSLREAPLVNGSYAYLVNDAGELQLSGDITRDQPNSAGLTELFRNPVPVDEYAGDGGEIVIGAWASIPNQPANWKVVVEIPRRLAYQTVERDRWFLVLEISIVILTTIGWSLYQARRILQPIQELRAGAMTIGAGDLASRIPIREGDEIGELAQEFNRMAGHLEHSRAEIERQNERLREGLALARDIQLGLLPKGPPSDTRHLVVHARSIPAYEVGGDFYTYISLDESRMAVAIGDISGKGVGAALMMALASSMVEAQGREIEQPQRLLSALNQQLTARLKANRMNAAILYAVLDLAQRTLCVANAGMIAPFLLRDGRIQTIETYGLPLGSMAGARYVEQMVELQPGDLIVLVSDGIVEAHSPDSELFGFERLEQLLSQSYGLLRPDQIVDDVMDDVVHFMAGIEQHDDMTVVVIQPNLQVIEDLRAPQPAQEMLV